MKELKDVALHKVCIDSNQGVVGGMNGSYNASTKVIFFICFCIMPKFNDVSHVDSGV